MGDCAVDLYWMPVGAGSSRFQRACLVLWEAFEAARTRRKRAALFHSALKLVLPDGKTYTLELTPAFVGGSAPPLATGPVGLRGADRFRLFRYQLLCLPADSLPDEEWAVGSPIRLTEDCTVAERLLSLAPTVPRHVWGRRARGTAEMWTSDSVISWLVVSSGIDLSDIVPPSGGRAPGWLAGVTVGVRGRGRRP